MREMEEKNECFPTGFVHFEGDCQEAALQMRCCPCLCILDGSQKEKHVEEEEIRTRRADECALQIDHLRQKTFSFHAQLCDRWNSLLFVARRHVEFQTWIINVQMSASPLRRTNITHTSISINLDLHVLEHRRQPIRDHTREGIVRNLPARWECSRETFNHE